MNPDTHYLFLSKSPVNETPPVSPTASLWRELVIYKAFLYTSLNFLVEIFLNKEIFQFSQKV